jgi:hypothetical protein
MNWMFLPLRRYFDIFGRSQRREFWLFFLMLWAVDAVIVTIFGSPVSYTNGMNFYWGHANQPAGTGADRPDRPVHDDPQLYALGPAPA